MCISETMSYRVYTVKPRSCVVDIVAAATHGVGVS